MPTLDPDPPPRDPPRNRAWVCWIAGVVAAGGAMLLWMVPWNAYDSRCSLATRNDPHVRGACADGVAALMPWFAVVVALSLALLVGGTITAARSPR